jgi:hypothetical protein
MKIVGLKELDFEKKGHLWDESTGSIYSTGTLALV